MVFSRILGKFVGKRNTMEVNKREVLIESFNLLKNNWDSKMDAIRECITQMALIDSDEAVNMWLKVAQKSKRNKTLDKDSSEMFNWTLYFMLRKLDEFTEIRLAMSIFKNREFCDYMYRLNTELGREESKIIKWAIFQNDVESLLCVLKNAQKNKSKDGFTIGRVVFEAINDYNKIRYEGRILANETKLALADFVKSIKSKVEKSEANVALMSII